MRWSMLDEGLVEIIVFITGVGCLAWVGIEDVQPDHYMQVSLNGYV